MKTKEGAMTSLSIRGLVFGVSTLTCLAAMPGIATEPENEKSINDLEFLIGEWEGQSTFLYPRDEDRSPAHETVQVSCAYVLKDSYIQCDTAWTNADDRTRTFRLHFNHNQLDEAYQVLFIYDNWPRHVSYLLNYDESKNAYIGFSEFEDAEGGTGEERVEWRLSDDQRELHSAEFNHLETDPDGFWANSFEFVWRKVD